MSRSVHNVEIEFKGSRRHLSDCPADVSLVCTPKGGWELRRNYEGHQSVLAGEFYETKLRVFVAGEQICGDRAFLSYPTIKKDPVRDALDALTDFQIRNQGRKPTRLYCGFEFYRDLMSVGQGFLKQVEDQWYLDGAKILTKSNFTDLEAE